MLEAAMASRAGASNRKEQSVPSQEGLEEPESYCRLMATNTIEDLLDPVRRAQIPSGFNYKRLAAILGKYRCCFGLSTASSLQPLSISSAQHRRQCSHTY